MDKKSIFGLISLGNNGATFDGDKMVGKLIGI